MQIDRETLNNLYWEQELTQREIAVHFNVTNDTVGAWMRKLGIPRRNFNQALVLSYRKNPETRGRNKGTHFSAEARENLSKAHKGQIPWRTGKPWSEEEKLRLSLAHKGQVSHNKGIPMPQELKEKHRKIKREYWDNPENNERREEIGRRVSTYWQDPQYVINQIQSRGARPNKPEKSLDDIVSKEFPEFKYNGDGRLGIALAGLVPDFVNVNGRKQVIEVFGLYWHQLKEPKWHQTELGRIMAYNSIGWDCLIIWENELKDASSVISKIRKFSHRELTHGK